MEEDHEGWTNRNDPWRVAAATESRRSQAAERFVAAEQRGRNMAATWDNWTGPLTEAIRGPVDAPTNTRTELSSIRPKGPPTLPPRRPATTRVQQDDELSEAQSWSGGSNAQAPPAQNQRPPVQDQRGPRSTNANAALLQRILQVQQFTSNTRSQPARRPRLASFQQHAIPISSAPSRSHRHVHSVFRDTPAQTQSSMARITETMNLMAEYRRNNHRDRDRDRAHTPEPRGAGRNPEDHTRSPPGPTQEYHSPQREPAAPWIGRTAGGIEAMRDGANSPVPVGVHDDEELSDPNSREHSVQREPVVQREPAVQREPSEHSEPTVYDGLDYSCSICQDNFLHGDRVCRMPCRHIFHFVCWDSCVANRLQQQQERQQQQQQSTTLNNPGNCPNCRGAGRVIAIWDYIESGADTQEVNGHLAENLLNEQASDAEAGPTIHHEVDGSATPEEMVRLANGTATQEEVIRITRQMANEEGVRRGFPPVPPRFTGGAYVGQEGEEVGRLNPLSGPSTSTSSLYSKEVFHSQTSLPDGRPSIIIDPGSVGNLCGDKWAKKVATAAAQKGHSPAHTRRAKPLKVSGVGKGSQECHYDCTLPVALPQQDGKLSVIGSLTTPAVQNSDLPGLLGWNTLRDNRAVLDFTTLKLHFCGPGDVETDKALPPGTETFQLEVAPSGHIVLPCCQFTPGSATGSEHTLTLVTKIAASSGSGTTEATAVHAPRTLPPTSPPVLPEEVLHARETPAPPSDDQ